MLLNTDVEKEPISNMLNHNADPVKEEKFTNCTTVLINLEK